MTRAPQQSSNSGSAWAGWGLLLAFAFCLVITVFSWPDPQDRKRAIGPKLAGCCEVRIAHRVIVERPGKAPRPDTNVAERH